MIHKMTKKGTTKKINNDVIRYEKTDDYLAAIITDGASCERYGKEGAEVTSQASLTFINKHFEDMMTMDEKEIGSILLEEVKYQMQKVLKEHAEEAGCTFALALYCYTSQELLIMSLGDTVIYGLHQGGWQVNLSPIRFQRSQTYLTTSKHPIIQTQKIKHPSGMILATDGFYECLKFQNLSVMHQVHTLDRFINSLQPQDDCSYIRLDF